VAERWIGAAGAGVAGPDGQRGADGAAVVCLATAHPAKFPDAVEAATGVRPPLPPHLADLLERPERIERCAADLDAVEALVRRAVATPGQLG